MRKHDKETSGYNYDKYRDFDMSQEYRYRSLYLGRSYDLSR